jgi:hypothetical protein
MLATESCPIGKWGKLEDMKYTIQIEIDADDLPSVVEKAKGFGEILSVSKSRAPFPQGGQAPRASSLHPAPNPPVVAPR